jgi:hypothetical protein
LDQESRDPGDSPEARPGQAGTAQPGGVPGARKPADGPDPAPVDQAAADPAAAVPPARTPTAQSEQEELERLRTEVRELRGRAAAGPARPAARGGRWRAAVSAVLITLGCILAPVSVLGVWAANQVSNTDRFVANMEPLIHEPAVQSALSARITTEIESRIDLPALISSTSSQLASAGLPRLSQLISNFSSPIESGIDSAIGTAVHQVVASPAMATIWVTALRTSHTGVVRVLSGQGNGSLSVVNNQVVLNLGPLITQVKDTLIARGFTVADRIPTVNATFPLFEAPNLARAQQGYRLITTLRWLLPLLTIALLVAGVWVARKTRHALYWAALGVAASMLVLGIALTIARGIYLNSVPTSVLPTDAAGVLYDTLIRFIREGLRVLLLVGLIVAAGAFLTGPAAAAVSTRRAVGKGIGWVRDLGGRHGVSAGPVGEWTAAHKTVLRVAAVAVVALIFVFVGQPTLGLVILLVVLLLVALGVIELLGGKPAERAAAEGVSPAQRGT